MKRETIVPIHEIIFHLPCAARYLDWKEEQEYKYRELKVWNQRILQLRPLWVNMASGT